MGLDMYAYITTDDLPPTGFDMPRDALEIAYWRKHHDLHGWMAELYFHKGGNAVFNCEAVRLDADDIDALEQAIGANALPPVSSFYGGESSLENKADDLAFIRKAREALTTGYSVFYTSWW